MDFCTELFLVTERIENLKWNGRWKQKSTWTAKLSLILRTLASFFPYQTYPFTEPLKVGSESYKVDPYNEEQQVTLWDRKGLSLTPSVSRDGWQSWLLGHQIWPFQLRQPGQHNPSTDLLGRDFWVFQERPRKTVRESSRLYTTTKPMNLDIPFLCVSKGRGKASKDKLPRASLLGPNAAARPSWKFLLIHLGNCYTVRTVSLVVTHPRASDPPGSLLLWQLCTYHLSGMFFLQLYMDGLSFKF